MQVPRVLEPGSRLGEHTIVAPLGVGGMGEVYRARDTRLERDVALKVLPAELATDPDRVARFEREAKSLAALSHPNIVTIYAVEEASGVRFITMELVEGETLDHLIARGGLPLDRVIAIGVPLADALASAHERGITHRDLKPGNIMIGADGRLRVLDFGLARRDRPSPSDVRSVTETTAMTAAGSFVGTVPYMSPEQARGLPADPRSDIFSLGIVLYEAAAGRRPFRGDTTAEVLAAILREEPTPLTRLREDLPPELWRVVRRCLEKDPRRPYQSALDVRNELEDLRTGSDAPAPGSQPATEGRRVGGVAVLPLANLSGDPAEEYFADGMTEALITDLAKVGRLKVISRTSVMQYKGTTKPLGEIARELRVDAIVEGSVIRSGNRVRISAQLIRAATDEHLWAERYDRDLEDVLALQDEVARAIAREVDATLHGPDSDDRATPRKVDPDVYLLVLRARHILHTRTEAGFRNAQDLFRQAIARDPTYAPAYVGLADSTGMLANYGLVPPKEIVPTALKAIENALALDETSADAYRALAFLRWQFEFDWTGAIEAYERSLELDPNSALTNYWFGACLFVCGYFERSFALLKRAEEQDPLSLLIPAVQGWARFFARRFEEALPYYRRVLTVDPDYFVVLWFQGQALVELGRFDEGISSLERALELSGGISRLCGYLGYSYGRAGREEEARASLRELQQRESRGYVPPYFPALVHAGLGETGAALDRLEQAHAIGDSMIRDLKADPHWDRMRAEPRFVALMEKMDYPDTDS